LTEREIARAGTQAGGMGEGEAGFPQSREPDAGLDPRTLGSRPEPKAATQPTEPRRHPIKIVVEGRHRWRSLKGFFKMWWSQQCAVGIWVQNDPLWMVLYLDSKLEQLRCLC